MPFDGNFTPTDRRRALIQALRSPMPEGFMFDYGSYDSCAVALARRLNLVGADFEPRSPWIGTMEPLGLTYQQARSLFSGAAYSTSATSVITPNMVADRLEQIDQELTR